MLTWFSVLALLFQAHSTPPAPAADASVRAAPDAVIVVELFTSQGCPLCPAANQLLADFGAREDVIALAWGVNYWDAYGWADQFAMPEFVDRQKAYVDAGEAMRVYTPHFVINGAPEQLRFDPARITAALEDSAPLPTAEIRETEDGAYSLSLEGARTTPAELWLVQYMPGIEERQIESGRNAGLRMTHFNMVRSVEKLADWTGGDAAYGLPEPAEGLNAVVLVQDGPGGRILTAARLP
ncbi:DUF1223 domain-containing protein [Oceanicaulis alexandrii]|uniref:DUF1223 domain-containing protein n=1 Tax=Oceanicaulis alexandrii TaxID=153233 RepID=UPI0003B7AE40|nr:DUF1223 domain-containing protein [Oceanicaulis alexandrii]